MKRLVGIMSLLLGSACGGSGGALGESPIINSQVADWHRGTGYIVTADVVSPNKSLVTLATGTIDASGLLSIQLPSSDALAPYLAVSDPSGSVPDGCTSKLVGEPADVKTTALLLNAKMAGSPSIPLWFSNAGLGSAQMAGMINALYTYVDRDSSVKGQQKCETASSSSTMNVDVKRGRGWNITLEKITEYSLTPSGSHVIVGELYSDALPSDVKLQLSMP